MSLKITNIRLLQDILGVSELIYHPMSFQVYLEPMNLGLLGVSSKVYLQGPQRQR